MYIRLVFKKKFEKFQTVRSSTMLTLGYMGPCRVRFCEAIILRLICKRLLATVTFLRDIRSGNVRVL